MSMLKFRNILFKTGLWTVFLLFIFPLIFISYSILIYNTLPSADSLLYIDLSLELFIWLDSLLLVLTVVALHLNDRK